MPMAYDSKTAPVLIRIAVYKQRVPALRKIVFKTFDSADETRIVGSASSVSVACKPLDSGVLITEFPFGNEVLRRTACYQLLFDTTLVTLVEQGNIVGERGI